MYKNRESEYKKVSCRRKLESFQKIVLIKCCHICYFNCGIIGEYRDETDFIVILNPKNSEKYKNMSSKSVTSISIYYSVLFSATL